MNESMKAQLVRLAEHHLRELARDEATLNLADGLAMVLQAYGEEAADRRRQHEVRPFRSVFA